MFLLALFSFLGGFVTILSPCILPILPIVLSGSLPAGRQVLGSDKRRPLGIVTGFILSFTFFTLFLSSIVRATGLSADVLRTVSVVILLLFGISLLLPQFQLLMEKMFTKMSSKFAVGNQGKAGLPAGRQGFGGGILIGFSIGLIWTPCVGPILASIITLAATSTVGFGAVIITLAYALGTAIPMFAIMYGGRNLLQSAPWLIPNAEKIQKAFGVLMIITAIGIFFNIDRDFQSYILEKFPKYGVGLTKFEDNNLVKKELDKLRDDDRAEKIPNDLGDKKIKAPEIIEGGEWFNSEPLTIEGLKGKVVLVDFWTYTCINCQRTFPYLKDWDKKYEDMGLVIIGVHSPEFEFEKNPDNVEEAINDFGLTHAVIQDNDFATWSAYSNRYWPAKYLIDKDGFIRYAHFGEGAYAETESVIQELLKETGKDILIDINNDTTEKRTVNASHETYLGYERMEFLMGQGSAKPGTQKFTTSKDISEDSFSFGGEWTVGPESSISVDNASISYNFNGEKVFLVMNPPAGKAGAVKVYLDGKLVEGKFAGKDAINGVVTVDSDRLYELIDLRGKPGNHLLRLEFGDGIEAFAFTFG